ncbi:MAG: hypothetical protein AMJ62_07045 [Myxococcales bacterium SG8_38]|nr:MAG: hypothetical protein AMJ62_07045 [Myxococcales bacterium SG8_38]
MGGMVLLGAMEPPQDPLPPTPSPLPAETRPEEPGFALSRDRLTLADLLSRASEAWSKDLGTWVLAMLLYWLLGFGIPAGLGVVWGFFSTIQETSGDAGPAFHAIDAVVRVVLQVVQLVLSAIFTLGMWAMAVRGLHRRRTTIAVLFSQLSKIWKYILQSLAVMLAAVLIVLPIVVIIFLAFIGPVSLDTPMSEIMDDAGRPFGIAALVLLPLYVYLATGIVFMQAELAFNDDAGPVEAIVYSWRIARGKRWRIIGVGLVSGLIWLGSAMLCGIGLLFGAPFALLLFGALYLGLRNGADVPSANTGTTLGRHY